MKIVIFAQFLFGFCIFIRILEQIRTKNLISSDHMTKIGTTFFVLMVIIASFFSRSPIIVLAFLYSTVIFVSVCEPLLRKWREKNFESEFLPILSSIILKMKAGTSFREALLATSDESDPFMRTKLQQIREAVVFSQQLTAKDSTPFLNLVINELDLVDKASHSAIQRLCNFRRKLDVESDFRRKSGQILLQLRMQSYILAGLYFALVIFVTTRFDFKSNFELMALSFLLFVIGFVWVQRSGRKIRWKV